MLVTHNQYADCFTGLFVDDRIGEGAQRINASQVVDRSAKIRVLNKQRGNTFKLIKEPGRGEGLATCL